MNTPEFAIPDAWQYWLSTIPPLREAYYHYTDVDAFLSIISSRRMWATNLTFMNDPRELTYGANLIREALERAIHGCGDGSGEGKWLAALKENIQDQLARNSWYSVSFCEEGDLLSQWRAYGAGGGGVALAWKTLSTRQDGRQPDRPLPIGVNYERAKQAEILDRLIQVHLDYLQGLEELSPEDAQARFAHATESLAMFLWVPLFSFKDAAFASELECRWVYPAFEGRIPGGKPLRFRRVAGMVKPYFEADFSETDLLEVVYGPTAHAELTEKWLRMALDVNGFPNTKVTPSRIVLR